MPRPRRVTQADVNEWWDMIADEKRLVRYGDLYGCLHNVGDDFTKKEIEEVLRATLDSNTFKHVVAIFRIATDNSIR